MADSLCMYMASDPRSHKGMCPGLAEQYLFMPDTEAFIGCPCTTFLPVPPCYTLSECVYVPHQAQVVCRDEHISSPAAIFVLIGLGPRLIFIHFVMEKRFIPRKAGLVYFCVPFMILTPVCQISSYLSSSEFRNTVLRANEKKAFSSDRTSSPIVPTRAQHGSPGRYITSCSGSFCRTPLLTFVRPVRTPTLVRPTTVHRRPPSTVHHRLPTASPPAEPVLPPASISISPSQSVHHHHEPPPSYH